LTYANVMATVAVFVALGGSSYAAIKVTGRNVKDSSLTGKDVKNSSLTTSDVKNASLLAVDFKSGQLPVGGRGPAGPQGLRGEPGDDGDPGQPATRLWAVINSDGSTARQSGVTSSAAAAPSGTYAVTFDRDVSGCSYQVTSGGPAVPGEVLAQPLTADANGVFVATANSSGTYLQKPFNLAVFC
jgi:hypothetical protein